MLGDILRKELLEAVLEPAIRITRSGEEIRGYESQLRLKSEGPLQKSKDLFRYAEKKTRVEDLELARLDRTLRAGAKIAAQTLLFVNIHPLALSADGRVCTALLRGAAANRIPIENLVVVITNQALHDDLHLEALAETGIAVALEDEDGSLRFLLDNAAIRCSH
jgi:EAL domain-containing protein (putative c-di-GMP-specific phosphodiesterase class I)